MAISVAVVIYQHWDEAILIFMQLSLSVTLPGIKPIIAAILLVMILQIVLRCQQSVIAMIETPVAMT